MFFCFQKHITKCIILTETQCSTLNCSHICVIMQRAHRCVFPSHRSSRSTSTTSWRWCWRTPARSAWLGCRCCTAWPPQSRVRSCHALHCTLMSALILAFLFKFKRTNMYHDDAHVFLLGVLSLAHLCLHAYMLIYFQVGS